MLQGCVDHVLSWAAAVYPACDVVAFQPIKNGRQGRIEHRQILRPFLVHIGIKLNKKHGHVTTRFSMFYLFSGLWSDWSQIQFQTRSLNKLDISKVSLRFLLWTTYTVCCQTHTFPPHPNVITRILNFTESHSQVNNQA